MFCPIQLSSTILKSCNEPFSFALGFNAPFAQNMFLPSGVIKVTFRSYSFDLSVLMIAPTTIFSFFTGYCGIPGGSFANNIDMKEILWELFEKTGEIGVYNLYKELENDDNI